MKLLRFVHESEPRLWTVGKIADHLGVPVHRVQYVVRSAHIRPAARAARLRLFDRNGVNRIEVELNRIDARTTEGGAS